jgi:hypothetical protein
MPLTYRTTLLTAMAQAILDAIATGGGTAYLRLYNGSRPANVGTAIAAQTLLCEMPLNNPAGTIGTTSGSGTITLNISSVSDAANNTGDADFFRIFDRAGNAVLDGSVGATGASNVDMTMPSRTITSPLTVQLTGTNTLTVSGYAYP